MLSEAQYTFALFRTAYGRYELQFITLDILFMIEDLYPGCY